MYISKQDFNQIESELISLYQTARKQGDIYVMGEVEYLVDKLQEIEIQNIRKKSSLKE